MPSSFKECLTHAGMGHLSEKVQAHIDAGIPEKEAVRKVLIDEHQKLHDDLNDLRKKVKVPTEAFIPHDNTQKVKEINDEYDKKIAQVPVETKTEIPESKEPTEVSQPTTESAEKPPTGTGGEPPIEETKPEPRTVGVSHEALNKLAKRLGLPEVPRGTHLSPEEYADRGRQLLNGGADPNQIEQEFKEGKQPSADEISISRAHLEDLESFRDSIGDYKGTDSPQYKDAQKEVGRWMREVVKPMGTKASEPFTALQGERDINTGSFTAIKNAKSEVEGKEIKSLPSDIQDLSRKVQKLTQDNEQLQTKLTEALDRAQKAESGNQKVILRKAKNLATKLRERAKIHKPGMFSAATPASVAWDGAVEVVAKGIEAGGQIAQAIADGIEFIKNTDWYRSLNKKEQQDAEKQFNDWHNEQLKPDDDILVRFAEKKGNDFTPQESKDIWDYAKQNYINDNPNFKVVDMVNKTAKDLGLTPEQVRHALGVTPETRKITDQIYRNQYEKNRAHQTIQRWVNKSKEKPVDRLLNTIAAPFRGLATLGHGHALLFTHAGMNLFDPKVAGKFFNLVGKQFKLVYGNEAHYEKAVSDLKNDKLYTTAVRSGLAVNPDTIYDDWQIANNFLKKLKIQGNKGFLVLKLMRMEMFKAEYNSLSNAEKADPDTLKNIAQNANLWSGTAGIKVSSAANALIFAPNLVVSKFARITTEPAKALITLTNWNKATMAEKAATKLILKKSGRILATYLVALAGNQALLSLSGSNQKINGLPKFLGGAGINPFQSDFLKFKAGDKTVDPTSGMQSTLQFLIQLGALGFENKKQIKNDYYGAASAGDAFKNLGIGELRRIASPLGAIGFDLGTHTDFQGNVVPWSGDKPRTGKEKLSPFDYFMEKAPIPLSEGYRVVADEMKQDGVSTPTIKNILTGVLIAAAGSGGLKVGNEPKQRPSPYSDEDKKDKRVSWVYNDWKMELPNTVASSENITDEDKATKIMLDKYPKETQDKYMKQHNEELFNVLGDIHSNGTVFVKKYKDEEGNPKNEVLLNVPKSGDYDEKSLDKLDESERKQVLRLAQQEATKKTKKDLFNQ